jgi:hypothetical protein
MNYEKIQDITIVLLDLSLTMLKGIKKLHGLLKKKGQKLKKVNHLNNETNGTSISSSSEPFNG